MFHNKQVINSLSGKNKAFRLHDETFHRLFTPEKLKVINKKSPDYWDFLQREAALNCCPPQADKNPTLND